MILSRHVADYIRDMMLFASCERFGVVAMNPIRIHEQVARPYFSCLIDAPRHHTAQITPRGIEAAQRQGPTPEDRKLRWPHRRREMVLSLLEGRTSAQCATIYRITRHRVSDIFRKEARAVQVWGVQQDTTTLPFPGTWSFSGWEGCRWRLN